MKLVHIYKIEADLELLTGLHIGGDEAQMHIGGIDNSVVKNPLNNEPYIPGSSLKGKIRSLLEWRTGKVSEKPLSKREYESAGAQQEEVKNILKLFGTSADSKDDEFIKEIGHSRLAFWDCALIQSSLREGVMTEAKSENSINRITGVADNPRQTERVPAGAKFKFNLSLREFEGDSEQLKLTVLKGLRLLELDSLGGSGSRGYGKVKFTNLTIDGQAVDGFEVLDPFKS